MDEYEKLVLAEKTCHTVEVREKATGKVGVVNTYERGVQVFYGADDGSDDKIISAEAFSRDFEITACCKSGVENNMIKNYNPRPFERPNPLPTYVVVTDHYELLAKTESGYTITLAKLTVGKSVSAGNQLSHALFEGFSDHGERMAVARTRVSGHERVFNAVMNAMIEVGVEFESVTPCHSETMLTALGAWLQLKNPDIEQYEVVSQS